MTPQEIMEAHQYLYYVLARPIWSDYEYDTFCQKNNLEGTGGSDLAASYSPTVVQLALSYL